MTKNELILGALITIALGFSGFVGMKSVETAARVSALEAKFDEAKVLREQGYARLAIVERILQEQLPHQIDEKLGQVSEQLRAITAEVAGVKTSLARVETKLEGR